MHGSQWLGIGDFARLGGVSIKALRLYADLGLLPPTAVNAHNGYRRYARSQLATLHRILTLKRAGFSLTEIRLQLAMRDDASLQLVRARLVERADEIQRQLSWIDAEIRSPLRVVVKRVPKLAVWSRRQSIDSYDQVDGLLRDLGREVPAKTGLVPGAVWHECGQRSGRIDCEVFWLSWRARVAPCELVPATVASILHEGDDSTIAASYDAVRHWLEGHGYQIAGPNRELYLAAGLTEIQFPIN
jgi:DNA-binding transcriptional MerR regulator